VNGERAVPGSRMRRRPRRRLACERHCDGSIQYVELSLNGAPLGLGPHSEADTASGRPSKLGPELETGGRSLGARELGGVSPVAETDVAQINA
jgi:hypothetical protein